MRRRNIRHGQKRRVSGAVLLPTVLLAILIGLLIWELVFFFGGA